MNISKQSVHTVRTKACERALQHTQDHPLESVYRGMMQRCGHWAGGANRNGLRRYKGRGIEVCAEWRAGGFAAFEAWALSHGWRKGLQIDRIDNDGNYEPNNCRFVTPMQNSRNRSANRMVSYQGKTILACELVEIAKRSGINENTVWSRLRKGWTAEQILSIKNGRREARGNRRIGNPRTLLKCRNQELTITELAKVAGVSRTCVIWRLRQGMTPEEILTTPKKTHKEATK